MLVTSSLSITSSLRLGFLSLPGRLDSLFRPIASLFLFLWIKCWLVSYRALGVSSWRALLTDTVGIGRICKDVQQLPVLYLFHGFWLLAAFALLLSWEVYDPGGGPRPGGRGGIFSRLMSPFIGGRGPRVGDWGFPFTPRLACAMLVCISETGGAYGPAAQSYSL